MGGCWLRVATISGQAARSAVDAGVAGRPTVAAAGAAADVVELRRSTTRPASGPGRRPAARPRRVAGGVAGSRGARARTVAGSGVGCRRPVRRVHGCRRVRRGRRRAPEPALAAATRAGWRSGAARRAARAWRVAAGPGASRREEGELELEAQAADADAARDRSPRAGAPQPPVAAGAVGAPSSRPATRPSGGRRRPGRGTPARSRPRSSSSSSTAMPAGRSPSTSAPTKRVDRLGVGEAEQIPDRSARRSGRRPRRGAGRASTRHRACRRRRVGRQGGSAPGSASRPSASRIRAKLALDLGDRQPPEVEPLEPRQDRRPESCGCGRCRR